MMNKKSFALGLLTVATLSICVPAVAEDRVLIMTISNYSESPLEGVKHDANNGYELARKLGYNTSKTVRLRDNELTLSGMKQALQNLVQQTHNGDRVFVYFSGHGGSSKRNNVCEQSIIAQDRQPLFSDELASYLEKIKDVASKVTVMLDSCFSGGVLNDVERVRSAAKASPVARVKAKSWTPKNGEACSNGVNLVAKAIPAMRSAKAMTDVSKNYIYITAAGDKEYALDNPESGGLASTSILKCLNKGIPNTDNSGIASVGELIQCAQPYVNQGVESINAAGAGDKSKWIAPHVNIVGNKNAPIFEAATTAVTTQNVSVTAVNTLKRLYEGQDARWGFSAQANKAAVSLNEKITIRYKSNQAGYVYVLYVGSDGKDFKQLYPASLGDTRFLANKEGYVGKDGGTAEITIEPPIGDNHFLVLLTESPRDFSDVFQIGQDGGLTASANTHTASNLGYAASGELRNTSMGKGSSSRTQKMRNASVSENTSSNEKLTGYGAALFVVKGVQ